MNKKRIVATLFILIVTILLFVTTSYGFGISNLNGNKTGIENNLEDTGNGIIKIVMTIGSIISVIVLVILGIKYMIGSVEERAEYKKTMLPYVIGAVLVFAASTIASIIFSVAINL